MAVYLESALAEYGELHLAPTVLEHVFGFGTVRNLNQELGDNFPWADFYATRGERSYIISVTTGARSTTFLGSSADELAAALRRVKAAGLGNTEPLWLVLALDADRTFDAYWGYLDEMRPTRLDSGGALAIDLTDDRIAFYKEHGRAALDLPHQFTWLDCEPRAALQRAVITRQLFAPTDIEVISATVHPPARTSIWRSAPAVLPVFAMLTVILFVAALTDDQTPPPPRVALSSQPLHAPNPSATPRELNQTPPIPAARTRRDATPAKSEDPPVRVAIRHKHAIGGCEGTLLLDGKTARFDSKQHSFVFSTADLHRHKDGFEDRGGKKWHFNAVDDSGKRAFHSWLNSLT
jgi:hypothetical protein